MYENYVKIRDARGLKDSDVSKGTGIAPSVFSDWKKGRYELKYDKLQKIAEFLGVTTDQLAGVQSDVQPDGYYKDVLAAMTAQQMFDDEQLRMLFHVKKNIDNERFKIFYDMIMDLYKQEHPDDDFYDREFTYRDGDGDH